MRTTKTSQPQSSSVDPYQQARYLEMMNSALQQRDRAESTLWQLLLAVDGVLLGALAAFLPLSPATEDARHSIAAGALHSLLGLEILTILLAAGVTVVLLHAHCREASQAAARYLEYAHGTLKPEPVTTVKRPKVEAWARKSLLWLHLAVGLLFALYLGLTILVRIRA